MRRADGLFRRRRMGRASEPMKEENSYRRGRTPAERAEQPSRRDGGLLEVDLSAVVDNWRFFQSKSEAEAAAVLKADAYGCGAAQVGPQLEAAGCRTFFTAGFAEATRLAAHLGPQTRIYVLNGFSAAAGGWPADPRLRPVLNTLAEARAWASAAPSGGKAGLQIETGMNRLGMTGEEQTALCAEAALGPNALAPDAVDLIMSHLAQASGADDPLMLAQKAAFDAASPRLRARFPQARRSLSATEGALRGEALAYDLIRPGVGLYGGLPFAQARPVVRLSAPIIRVWTVETGARSGYGGDWTARRPSRLATIPLGYADGVLRSLGGRGAARIGGRAAPFAGRVSMDLIVLDVTDLDPAPVVGDRAYLLDQRLTVDAMARAAGTIGYEILTGLDAARRLERRVNLA